ncbi:RNA-directed DNA polymerase [Corynebacterium sp. NML120713]|uniref:RNA-directed DNA polymerase n=1 Tax=Corynebacterium sp. NML120713 TaxID=1906332 RepID=UPI0008FB48C2|nr:RNA-directed DNA polymerase [Corynebacterium sp. NML120713]OIR41770.1 hypothetical protein BJP06_09665 [Corynebacterium sp. NML120713]
MTTSAVDEKTILFNAIFREQWLNFINKYPALPPIISTESFTIDLMDALASIPTIADPSNGNSAARRCQFVGPCSYQVVRFDGKVRFLEFPHPWPYAKLGKALIDNWDKLGPLCDTAESLLRPRLDLNSSRIIAFNYGDREDEWLSALDEAAPFVNGRSSFDEPRVLALDIANFFPSIYTHALDWAISKGRFNSRNSLGSSIDYAYTYVRNNRTDGVSIGPITSNIAAEIILNELDKYLQDAKRKGELDFRRYVDDVEILIPASTDPSELISDISMILKKYSLTLNHTKQSYSTVFDFLANDIGTIANQFLETWREFPSRGKLKVFIVEIHQFSQKHQKMSLPRYLWPSLLTKAKEAGLFYEFLVESMYLLPMHPELIQGYTQTIADSPELITRIAKSLSAKEFLTKLFRDSLRIGSVEFTCWLIYLSELLTLDLSHVIGDFVQQVLRKNGTGSASQFPPSLPLSFSDAEALRNQMNPILAVCLLHYSYELEKYNHGVSNFTTNLRDLLCTTYTTPGNWNDARMAEWSPE